MTTGLELLADTLDGRLHVAVMRKGRLDNLYVDPLDRTGCWASLHLGKVAKIDTRLNAAFVDLGGGLTGFLAAKHVGPPAPPTLKAAPAIGKLVQPGQMLLVQIKAEGRKGALTDMHKLPRVTTRLCIFGDFIVYSPLLKQMVVPRQIEDAEIRTAAAKLDGTKGGWIFRRSAAGAQAKDILFEAQSLISVWRDIEAARGTDENTPRVLRAGPDAISRALCEHTVEDLDHVHVADKALLDNVLAWSEIHGPALGRSKRLRLFRPDSPREALFDLHDACTAIAALREAHVPLESGGSIIIEQTHALVVIDVNIGSSANTLQANMDAVAEVARQTRLRNLSGAVLVDFIGVPQKNRRAELITALEKAFGEDTGSAQVHGFTRLGIIEITRKRRAATLHEKWRN